MCQVDHSEGEGAGHARQVDQGEVGHAQLVIQVGAGHAHLVNEVGVILL